MEKIYLSNKADSLIDAYDAYVLNFDYVEPFNRIMNVGDKFTITRCVSENETTRQELEFLARNKGLNLEQQIAVRRERPILFSH